MSRTTRMLTQGAIMVALATILSLFTLYQLPNGGSVTFASMAPIIVISLLYPFRWAFLTAFAYSLVQMLLGFVPPPSQTFLSFVAVVLLDYVVAFSGLSLAGPISRRIGKPICGAVVGTCLVSLLRLGCSFLSGILIWDIYAPEGTPVWIYSITYNGSYMIPEMVVTAIVVALVVKYIPLKQLSA